MAIALGLVKVSKRFGAQPILEDLTFGLQMGEKVGLIGRNGAGKSTLFKLLAGEDLPDSGEVVLTQGLRVAHLSQDPHFAPDATVRTALETALADHRELIRRHGEIHEALTRAAGDRAAEERLHMELDAVEHHLDHMGWDLEPRLKEAQTTWGLVDLEATVESLSGGWRSGWRWPRPGSRTRTCWSWTSPPTTWTRSRWRSSSSGSSSSPAPCC
jgi:ATPase subunit of ABC transporter with duplicated ATPase domains